MKQFSSFNSSGHLNMQSADSRNQIIRQLQGFSVFTGTAHWHSGVKLDSDTIHCYAERGRLARSKAVVGAFANVWDTVISVFQNAAAWVSERYRTRLAVKELSSLNTRMLKDIGITRYDIALLASGTVTVAQINARRQMQKPRRVRLVPKTTLAHSKIHREKTAGWHPVLDQAA